MTEVRLTKGFSLIELMVVVLILGILMAVALPGYQKHAVKTKRAEAVAILMNTAQALERCYSRNSSYVPITGDEGDIVKPCKIVGKLKSSSDEDKILSETGIYLVTGDVESTRFELKATPQNKNKKGEPDLQKTREDKYQECGYFTLDQTGKRGNQYTDKPEDCW